MKVWVFVEGESDRIALETLWVTWRTELGKKGWGIQIHTLDDKSHFFRKIGHRTAEKLANNREDLVVGLPDLYPHAPYARTKFKHSDLTELKTVQLQLVKDALQEVFQLSPPSLQERISRFFPSALKYDLEVLLLAAEIELQKVLGTKNKLGKWRHPVEDQNQEKPPKQIVEELFKKYLRRNYRDTIHAKAVLEKVPEIKKILFNDSGQLECPVFKQTLDWIAEKTGVPAY